MKGTEQREGNRASDGPENRRTSKSPTGPLWRTIRTVTETGKRFCRIQLEGDYKEMGTEPDSFEN